MEYMSKSTARKRKSTQEEDSTWPIPPAELRNPWTFIPPLFMDWRYMVGPTITNPDFKSWAKYNWSMATELQKCTKLFAISWARHCDIMAHLESLERLRGRGIVLDTRSIITAAFEMHSNLVKWHLNSAATRISENRWLVFGRSNYRCHLLGASGFFREVNWRFRSLDKC